MKELFDPQVLIFAALTCAVILITLIVLAVITRRVRFLMSEVQGLRREMALVDEALQTVTQALEQMGRQRPR
ncbi:MAG: hypothetical protein IPG96_02575 [Proteobacteria bacterium]|jgi:sensor domain CHASE-containing protein|nr:hypothetical protein [Pseudomonadota bacterium]